MNDPSERDLRQGYEDDGLSESEIEDALDAYEAAHDFDPDDNLND